MIQGIDNKMLFGALNNLRLAPHVREGRAVSTAVPSGSVGSNAPAEAAGMGRAESPAPVPASAQRPAEVSSEKLSISAEAQRAFEQSVEPPKDLEQAQPQEVRESNSRDSEVRADERADRQAASAPSNAVVTRAAQAYGQESAPSTDSSPASSETSRGAIPAQGLFA